MTQNLRAKVRIIRTRSGMYRLHINGHPRGSFKDKLSLVEHLRSIK